MPDAAELRREFLIDPEVTFLNHGSFGACPRPVFERYQAWQRELEAEPVHFIARRLPGLLAEARAELAAAVGASADDLAFVPNATTGVNMAARALDLRPGDEVLATDLEYGACDLAWRWVCDRAGARYVRAETPRPLAGPGDVLAALRGARTDRTRAVFLSHITSGTALVLPVAEVVAWARAEGLVAVVDGAHAPGQVPLDLDGLGADFYSGNCHKWLCNARPSGFLAVRADWRDRVDGAIVSWGYEPDRSFQERIEMQGTRDPSAWLTVPDAIRFVQEHDRLERCVALCREARSELCALLGTAPIAPDGMLARMASVRLPEPDPGLTQRLYDEHRIEVPVSKDGTLLRVSIAMYNDRSDVDRLLAALAR